MLSKDINNYRFKGIQFLLCYIYYIFGLRINTWTQYQSFTIVYNVPTLAK